MVRSQKQEPQRASGDDATVGRLFLLDLSGDRIVSLTPDGSDRKVIVTECRYPDGPAVDVGVSTLRHDHLAVGAVRSQRNDSVAAEVEQEQASHCGIVAGRTLRFLLL